MPSGSRAFACSTLGAMLLACVLTSCASFSEPLSVPVRNDLTKTVILAVCGSHDCSKRLDPWVLRPGQSGAVNLEIRGGYGPAILIDNRMGAVIGCLPFRQSRRLRTLSVAMSQAVPCGDSGGVGAANGKDWPISVG